MANHEEQLDSLLPLAEGHHKHFSMLLLTQEHCGFCEQAQDILQRLSQEYWLSVSTLDMASPFPCSPPCPHMSQGKEIWGDILIMRCCSIKPLRRYRVALRMTPGEHCTGIRPAPGEPHSTRCNTHARQNSTDTRDCDRGERPGIDWDRRVKVALRLYPTCL